MIQSLHTAGTGLYSSQSQIEEVMNNLANENTEGYKKRVVDVREASLTHDKLTGRGTEVGGVNRITDRYTYDKLMGEESKEKYYKGIDETLTNVESIFFETETSGLSYDLDKYFQSLEDFRSNPQNEVYEQNYIVTSKLLVTDIKNVYNELNETQTMIKKSAYEDVKNINTLINEIAKVNKKIYNDFQDTPDLYDKRDLLEKQLAEYGDIEVIQSPKYSLKFGGKVVISLNDVVSEVKINEDYQTQKDVYTDTSLNDDNLTDGQKIKFQLNNTYEIEITADTSYNSSSDGDDNYNVKRQLRDAINNDSYMQNYVRAEVDQWGDLKITSVNPGKDGEFTGVIAIETPNSNADETDYANGYVPIDEKRSTTAEDIFTLQVLGQDINLEQGYLKAKVENLDTRDINNKIESYKKKLNQFAKAFVDMHDKFIKQNNGNYISGEIATDNYALKKGESVTEIAVFKGTDVKSLYFDDNMVNNFNQDKLDYLATLQWNEEIDFDGTGNNKMGFSQFYQTIQTSVAADKESNNSLYDSQKAVKASLEDLYNKRVKVDKDEEMMNLIKFQAAYEANAKVITTVDSLLKTILGMKQ